VLRQRKVSKRKAARLPLESLGTSLCLALRVRCMQIGYPADLSCVPRFHRGLPEEPSLALWQRAASQQRPYGLFPVKAPVLGAATGIGFLPAAGFLRFFSFPRAAWECSVRRAAPRVELIHAARQTGQKLSMRNISYYDSCRVSLIYVMHWADTRGASHAGINGIKEGFLWRCCCVRYRWCILWLSELLEMSYFGL